MNDKYDIFISRVMFLPLLNAGHNSISGIQDKYVESVYNLAYELLVYADKLRQDIMFGRVAYMVNGIRLDKEILNTIKYPEMYEKMLVARKTFKLKIDKKMKEDLHFKQYCQKYMLDRGK